MHRFSVLPMFLDSTSLNLQSMKTSSGIFLLSPGLWTDILRMRKLIGLHCFAVLQMWECIVSRRVRNHHGQHDSSKPYASNNLHLTPSNFNFMVVLMLRTGQFDQMPKGGGTPGNSWWGCAARLSKSWPYLRPKNVIFHARFQTWPFRNYVIIT